MTIAGFSRNPPLPSVTIEASASKSSVRVVIWVSSTPTNFTVEAFPASRRNCTNSVGSVDDAGALSPGRVRNNVPSRRHERNQRASGDQSVDRTKTEGHLAQTFHHAREQSTLAHRWRDIDLIDRTHDRSREIRRGPSVDEGSRFRDDPFQRLDLRPFLRRQR